MFEVNVDEYSVLDLAGTGSYFKNEKETINTMIQAYGNQGNSTYEVPYRTFSDDAKVFSIMSAVVFIYDGKIESIEWDNACYGCLSDCAEYTISSSSFDRESNCKINPCGADNEGECDLRVTPLQFNFFIHLW